MFYSVCYSREEKPSTSVLLFCSFTRQYSSSNVPLLPLCFPCSILQAKCKIFFSLLFPVSVMSNCMPNNMSSATKMPCSPCLTELDQESCSILLSFFSLSHSPSLEAQDKTFHYYLLVGLNLWLILHTCGYAQGFMFYVGFAPLMSLWSCWFILYNDSHAVIWGTLP